MPLRDSFWSFGFCEAEARARPRRSMAVAHVYRSSLRSIHLTILAVLLPCSPTNVFPQHSTWIHGSAGIAVGDNYGGVCQSLSFHRQQGAVVYSAHVLYSDRANGLVNVSTPPPDLDQLRAVAVTIGYAGREHRLTYGGAAGPGVAWGKHNGRRNDERFSVLSAQLDVWGGVILTDHFGIGLTLEGIANSRRSIGTVSASVFVRFS